MVRKKKLVLPADYDESEFILDNDSSSIEGQAIADMEEIEYQKRRHASLRNAVTNAKTRLKIALDNLSSYEREIVELNEKIFGSDSSASSK